MKNWWDEGVRFQCQGSGKCCVSHGEYGNVWLTIEDRRRIAKHLKMTTREFTSKHCERSDGLFRLKEEEANCRFLKGKSCGIYEARPVQCRTWPWWPEVMNAKTWKKEVAAFCPGIGKGRVWTKEEIEKDIAEQSRTERMLGQERTRS